MLIMKFVLALFVLPLFCNAAPCPGCKQEEKLQSWIKDLFDKVPAFPLTTNIGRLITFGEDAYPVLLGKSQRDVIMAAAQLKRGRVFVAGKPFFFENLGGKEDNKNLANFHNNLKKWLTNGTFKNSKQLCIPKDSQMATRCLEDSSVKVVVILKPLKAIDKQAKALLEWVQLGGALVFSVDYNRFIEHRASVNTLAGYNVIVEAGIAYDSQKVKYGTKIAVSQSKESIRKFVSSNYREVAKNLTAATVHTNEALTYITDLIVKHQKFFPLDVARGVMLPFETFATNLEKSMTWPRGSIHKPKDVVKIDANSQGKFELFYALAFAHLWRKKAPNVDRYPGDLENPPPTSQDILAFDSGSNIEFLSTGYYLLPGQTMTLEVLNDVGDDSWMKFSVIVGCHTDNLKNKHDKIARWPLIKRDVGLHQRVTEIRWMFGGLITIKAPKGKGSHLKLKLSGVIEAPFVDISDPASVSAWWSRRDAPGLWADIRSENMRLTFQASAVRNIERPQDIMEHWESVVTSDYDLINTDRVERRKQWMTADIQISVGSLHSGYPINGHSTMGQPTNSAFLMNGKWENHWGMFHEVGHNLQDKAWTWGKTGEVTNNIFALLQMERLALHKDWPIPDMASVLTSNSYKNWLKDPVYDNYPAKVHLLVYSQFIRDFGWDCMHGVFVSYAEDRRDGAPRPGTTEDKMYEWVVRSSMIVNYNLCPLFEFWKWPLPQKTCEELSSLQSYIPDDVITQNPLASHLLSNVLTKYPNVTRTADVMPDCPAFEMNYRKI